MNLNKIVSVNSLEINFKERKNEIHNVVTFYVNDLHFLGENKSKVIKSLVNSYMNRILKPKNMVIPDSIYFLGTSSNEYYQFATALRFIDDELSRHFNDGLQTSENGLVEITKDKEKEIDCRFNTIKSLMNNGLPIIQLVIIGLCYYNDAYRVFEDIENVGENYEEDPLNIQHSAAFSQFLAFFHQLLVFAATGVRYFYLSNWETSIIVSSNRGHYVNLNDARPSHGKNDLNGDGVNPGLFTLIGKYGVGSLLLSDNEEEDDHQKDIVTEMRNAITAKEFPSCNFFPQGRKFHGGFFIFGSSQPDWSTDARFLFYDLVQVGNRVKRESQKLHHVLNDRLNKVNKFAYELNKIQNNENYLFEFFKLGLNANQQNNFFGIVGLTNKINHALKELDDGKKLLSFNGNYGVAKTEIANILQKRCLQMCSILPNRLMYLSVKGASLDVNFGSGNSDLSILDKDKQISIFDSQIFLATMTSFIAIYLCTLTWILFSSVEYHDKRSSFNDTYTQVLFSIILMALNYAIGAGVNIYAIYALQKRYPLEESIKLQQKKPFIAANTEIRDLTVVAKEDTGIESSRFSKTTPVLVSKDLNVLRVEDEEKLPHFIRHLIMRATICGTVPMYPSFRELPSKFKHIIVTSNKPPFNIGEKYLQNLAGAEERSIIIFNILCEFYKAITGDYSLREVRGNANKNFLPKFDDGAFNVLLSFYLNESQYLICRQTIKVIRELATHELITDKIIKKTFYDLIISQPYGDLNNELKQLNADLINECERSFGSS